ncbi:MAG: heme ABC exporter ATP-binding protein CcmA [Alphaproteobacteria bacterium]
MVPAMVFFAGRELVCLRGERVVFSGLSFALARGDAMVLVGRNGSGKSSLLRVMAGLLRPLAGSLEREGQPVALDPEAHGAAVRYVGHMDAIKSVLTVEENLAFWSGMHQDGTTEISRKDAVSAALDRVGLKRLAGQPGRLLSAGQRRRLNLARLLVAPSVVWLLDEPATALDVGAIAMVETIVAEHRERGGIVVLSTHSEMAVPGATRLCLDDYEPRNEPGGGPT